MLLTWLWLWEPDHELTPAFSMWKALGNGTRATSSLPAFYTSKTLGDKELTSQRSCSTTLKSKSDCEDYKKKIASVSCSRSLFAVLRGLKVAERAGISGSTTRTLIPQYVLNAQEPASGVTRSPSCVCVCVVASTPPSSDIRCGSPRLHLERR